LDRDASDRCLLQVSVNGRSDWWVQPLPLEVEVPNGIELRHVDPLTVELILPPWEVAGLPIQLTVRWRAGTPGEGSASASLPIPPP